MVGTVAVAILPAGDTGQQELRHLDDGIGLHAWRTSGLRECQHLGHLRRSQQGRIRLRQALEHQLPGLLLQRISSPAARLQQAKHGTPTGRVDQVDVLVDAQQFRAIDADAGVAHDQEMQLIAGVFHHGCRGAGPHRPGPSGLKAVGD